MLDFEHPPAHEVMVCVLVVMIVEVMLPEVQVYGQVVTVV